MRTGRDEPDPVTSRLPSTVARIGLGGLFKISTEATRGTRLQIALSAPRSDEVLRQLYSSTYVIFAKGGQAAGGVVDRVCGTGEERRVALWIEVVRWMEAGGLELARCRVQLDDRKQISASPQQASHETRRRPHSLHARSQR